MNFEIDATIQYALGKPVNWWPVIKVEDCKTLPTILIFTQGRRPLQYVILDWQQLMQLLIPWKANTFTICTIAKGKSILSKPTTNIWETLRNT